MGANTRRSSAQEAGQLIVKRIAAEPISALKLVKSAGLNECEIASSNGTYEDSQVLGLALNAGGIGDEIKILIVGVTKDASFVFTQDEPLFLDPLGNVTETAPTTGFRVQVGRVLGNTEILIELKENIQLA